MQPLQQPARAGLNCLASIGARHLLGWLALAAALAWTFALPLGVLVSRWYGDPAYSHGFLVPVFALALLWYRRHLARPASTPGSAWGLLIIALAALMNLASAYWYYVLLAPYSLLPCLAGICLWLGGWPKFRWAWPSIAFLFFMVPLPGRFADMLGHPLQSIATKAGTYALQLIGIPAVAEGNVILLTEGKIGVVEACSGLKMMILFFALATAVAIVINRNFWEKLLIVASAVPIAVISNVARIALTAAVHEWFGAKAADIVFHDFAGFLMMPLALGLLGLELAILSRLFIASNQRPVGLADALLEPAVPGRSAGPQPAKPRDPLPPAKPRTASAPARSTTT
ncbi:MAG: exosortase/archaeosortase family protein [Pirellulales bacterium]